MLAQAFDMGLQMFLLFLRRFGIEVAFIGGERYFTVDDQVFFLPGGELQNPDAFHGPCSSL
jgi:nitroreductase